MWIELLMGAGGMGHVQAGADRVPPTFLPRSPAKPARSHHLDVTEARAIVGRPTRAASTHSTLTERAERWSTQP